MTKPNATDRPVRVGLISLGCAKNLVDAEIMLGALLHDGLEIINDAARADVVIVNTCSFIDSAQEESVDAILASAELREAKNRGQSLIVSGCLPQRFRDDLPRLLPEVDAFMGIDQVAQVSEIVRQAMSRRAERMGGIHRTPDVARRPSKEKIASRLAELDQARNPAARERPESPRGEDGEDMARQSRNQGRARSPSEPGCGAFGESALPVSSRAAKVPTHFSAGRERGGDTNALVAISSRPTYIPDYSTPCFRLTPRHFAYVKIAEGCNHPCSFCIIPRMRGSHRSRPPASVVEEARRLLADGVRELNLISQDSTYYGLDLRPGHRRGISSPDRFQSAVNSLPAAAPTICTLLRELNALPGDFWIRLLYTHPAHWTDELIRTIAECPKVARYVDIPLQHIHENLLERMRRETSQEHIVGLLRRIRAGVPGIALRTTFIVGFPGETEACFRELLDFIRDTKFERLGVFTYSREDGTRAGGMAGQIPDRIKRRRRDLAMAAQQAIAREVSGSFVGRTIKVLVEGEANAGQLRAARISSWEHGLLRDKKSLDPQLSTLRYQIARGEADAPDIDGRVYVRGRLPIGEFARVKIVGHTDYDLIGEPL